MMRLFVSKACVKKIDPCIFYHINKNERQKRMNNDKEKWIDNKKKLKTCPARVLFITLDTNMLWIDYIPRWKPGSSTFCKDNQLLTLTVS